MIVNDLKLVHHSVTRLSDEAEDLRLSILESLDLIERSKALLSEPVFRPLCTSPGLLLRDD